MDDSGTVEQTRRAMSQLRPGSHACLFHETDEERFAAVAPFLRAGLEQGERCVYIADASTTGQVLEALLDNGIDVGHAVDSGALTVLTAHEAYLRGGAFDPDAMLGLLAEMTRQAVADGFAALRATGEMTWSLGAPGAERLLEYEARLNRFLPEQPACALCQYDLTRFPMELLWGIVKTHPYVIVNSTVCENLLYSPDSNSPEGHADEPFLRAALASIVDAQRTRDALEARSYALTERVKELTCLHSLSRLIETPGITLEGILQGVTDLIPPAWQYPEITCGAVTLGGDEYRTRGCSCVPTPWVQSADIGAHGATVGAVLVRYVEPPPGVNGDPFLPEEHLLLTTIAERLGSVTERFRVEETLRASEQRYRALFDQASVGIALADPETGVLLDCNRAMTELVGRTRDELVGQHQSLLHPDDHPRGTHHTSDYEQITGSTEHQVLETRLVRADGGVIDVEVRGGLVEVGGCRIAQGFFRDITDRKWAQEAIAASEERFRGAFEQAAVGMCAASVDGHYQRVNRRLCEILGRDPNELLGSHFSDWLHPCERHEAQAVAERLRAGDVEVVFVERRYLRPNGEVVWADTTVAALRDGAGRIAGFLAVIQDISDRKQAQAELERAAADLVRSNADLQHFAHIASHDLREPLRMVTSYLALVNRKLAGTLDAETEQFMRFAVDGAERMRALIDGLFAYSRVGADAEEPQPTDSARAASAAIADLRAAIDEAAAEVTCGPLPTVRCNEAHLTQIFQNLIGNALKFRRVEPVRVDICAAREGSEWHFAVQDNGIGIDSPYAERIFQIFRRLHTREEYPGTGVGLAVCRRVVERAGGRMWVDSRLGEGSTFRFTLPAADD